MKSPNGLSTLKRGFTLVELLVVLLIITVVAGLLIGMVTKMRQRADMAKQTSILHQIGPLMVLHTTERSGLLPATVTTKANGSIHWHQALHALTSSDLPIDMIKSYDYWNKHNPLIKNPLYKKTSPGGLKLQPWCPGYGMNTKIVDNLKLPVDYSNGEWQANRAIPLAAIGDPARTPLVAPAPDYHFGTIKDKDPNMEQFMINKQIPVLFVDGHVENIAPKEYEARRLHMMPR
jgi:prepilin-type N-terminal cleavage/methylation domain-containing protein/prepilin-type processing-associated H-X9-DG protein